MSGTSPIEAATDGSAGSEDSDEDILSLRTDGLSLIVSWVVLPLSAQWRLSPTTTEPSWSFSVIDPGYGLSLDVDEVISGPLGE
ncbi:hypothetical protein MY10362_006584 [Beauveria mimosiformis]